ncbi:MAG: hypothetical protein KDB23_32385 [Planctomycetales bacterium]|nr:hypothetical protein [Planctomycetales bacterium]
MSDLQAALFRLAIAGLVAFRKPTFDRFAEIFREVEREVLRGRDDLPANNDDLVAMNGQRRR